MTKSKIFATLSWVGPERPYGKIDHYQIVLSSPKTVSLIGSTTLDVKVIFKGKQHTLLAMFMFICLLRNISMPTGYIWCCEYGTAVGCLHWVRPYRGWILQLFCKGACKHDGQSLLKMAFSYVAGLYYQLRSRQFQNGMQKESGQWNLLLWNLPNLVLWTVSPL